MKIINKNILLKKIIKTDFKTWITYRDEAKKKETTKKTTKIKTEEAAEMKRVINLNYI
jgi:hypothetical protein